MGKDPVTRPVFYKTPRTILIVGMAVVTVILFVCRSMWVKDRKHPGPPEISTVTAPATATISADEFAKPHLERAERNAEHAIDEHVKKLETFFTEAKSHSRTFAEASLGFSSKWRFLADKIPYSKGDRHELYIREKFEEHIFKPDQLKDEVEQVVKSYLKEVRSIESQMLVDLRADTPNFPTKVPLSNVDDKLVQEQFDQAISQSRAAIGKDLQGDVGTQIASLISGEVLTQLAIRLGVSAGILTAGGTLSWATLGIGAVVGLIVDYVVAWIWNWWADPAGQFAEKLDMKLDELHTLLVDGSHVDGSPDVQGLRDRLKEYARERATHRKNAVLILLQSASQGVK